jgi:hypothetical protein
MGEKETLVDIHSAHVAHLTNHPELRTFKEWVMFGKKFARLAGGGSIYLLLLIAGLDLRWDLAKAPQATVFSVGEMLRKPSGAKECEYTLLNLVSVSLWLMRVLACQTLFPGIIDTVAKMRQALPLQLEVEGFQPVDCTDLTASDLLFDQLKMRQGLLSRRNVTMLTHIQIICASETKPTSVGQMQ